MIAPLFACLFWSTVFAPAPSLVLYIREEAARNGVPAYVAEAIIQHESRWNPFAVRYNRNGTVDRGLWQINSATLPWLEERYNKGKDLNVYDPYSASRVALAYLGALYSTFESWPKALEAYNGGPMAVHDASIALRGYAANVLAIADVLKTGAPSEVAFP